jgi:hypothetical protein
VTALARTLSDPQCPALAIAVLVVLLGTVGAVHGSTGVTPPGGARMAASTGPGGNNSTTGGSRIDFLESGLPAGAVWSVSLGSATTRSNQTLVEVGGLAAGTYAYAISTAASYTPYPMNGSVSVRMNSSAAVTVIFTANPAPAPTILGLPVLEFEVMATVVVVGGIAAILSEIHARRKLAAAKPKVPPSAPPSSP